MGLTTTFINYQGKKRIPCALLLLLSFFLVSFLSGCQEEIASNDKQEFTEKIIVNTFQIPVFQTAEEQLNYTRSWFNNHQEKLAALEAVTQLFPDARLQGGLATLDLVYQRLGSDYRLTDKKTLENAVADYQKITKEYEDIPLIMAKAHWYLGWLLCDLLDRKEEGIRHYETLIAKYPHVERSLAPPIRWIRIKSTSNQTSARTQAAPNIPWSHLATLEILRHSNDANQAWIAFSNLLSNGTRSDIIGLGYKLLLQRHDTPPEVIHKAENFLNTVPFHQDLRNDLQKALRWQKVNKNVNEKEGAQK